MTPETQVEPRARFRLGPFYPTPMKTERIEKIAIITYAVAVAIYLAVGIIYLIP